MNLYRRFFFLAAPMFLSRWSAAFPIQTPGFERRVFQQGLEARSIAAISGGRVAFYAPRDRTVRVADLSEKKERVVFSRLVGFSTLDLFFRPGDHTILLGMACTSFAEHLVHLVELDAGTLQIRKKHSRLPIHLCHIRGLHFTKEGNDIVLHSLGIDGLCARYYTRNETTVFYRHPYSIYHTLKLDDGPIGIFDGSMTFRLLFRGEEVYQKPSALKNAMVTCMYFYGPLRRLVLGLSNKTLVSMADGRDPIRMPTDTVPHRVYIDAKRFVLVSGNGAICIGDPETFEIHHLEKNAVDVDTCDRLTVVNENYLLIDGHKKGLIVDRFGSNALSVAQNDHVSTEPDLF